MHGVIHRRLKQYVEERMPDGAWDRVVDHAGVEPKLYLPVAHYPDEEFTSMVDAIADLSGHEAETVRRDFGRFLAPEILSTFSAHVKGEWSLLDLLEHLDEVYEEIESQNEDNDPPTVSCDRVVSDMAVLTYESERKLCEVGLGVIEGLAKEYDEEISIEEDRCMLDGDDHCEFTVERV